MATDTQAIKDRLDIVQVIGEYLPLKKAGANWKANCPFHHEKSPSFMVHQDKQIWHCFGCGKGGDIFSFIQEIEGLDFVESLKLLGNRAGVKVEFSADENNSSLRNRLLEINIVAANFFNKFLTEMAASEPARKYLQNRGLKQDTIKDWQVGFVPDQWDLLTKYLIKKGFDINDIVLSGLAIKRENADEKSGRGFYDRFRGRIMFPICDTHSNVIGFTGRVLVETDKSGGKYVNTPETALYEKSRVLYGIHRAKQEIKVKDQAVLVEGQMDVIACHQSGMTNVVAASGTALTAEQIKLLKRYSNNIAMAFDADAAGQKAGQRGIDIAIEQGMNIRVIEIPEGAGKDADECLKKNPKIWFDSVKNARSVMDWYFSIHLNGVNKNDFTAKKKAANSLLTEISKIPNAVERDEWLKKLSNDLAIDQSALREDLKKIKVKVQPSQKNTPTVEPIVELNPKDIMEDKFWSLMLKFPENYGLFRDLVVSPTFFGERCRALYEVAEKIYNKLGKISVVEVGDYFKNEHSSPVVDLLLLKASKDFEGLSSDQATSELKQLFARIKQYWKMERGQVIQSELAEAEKNKDNNKVAELMEELKKIQSS